MKKKHIALITISVIVVSILIAGFIAFCFWCMFNTLPSTRKKIYNYYSNAEFITVYGTIKDVRGKRFLIEFDSEWLLSLSESEKQAYGINIARLECEYEFPPKSEDILFNSELLNSLTNDDEGNINDNTVFAFTVDNSIWWDGGRPFAIGLSAYGKVYLDPETGRLNLLDYVQNEMP